MAEEEREKAVEHQEAEVKQGNTGEKTCKYTEKEHTITTTEEEHTIAEEEHTITTTDATEEENTIIPTDEEHTITTAEEDHTITTTETTISITRTTKTPGKRSRNGDEEQEHHGGKRLAIYGNYDHYYGYRVLKDADDDPRLKHFKQEWFEGRDCLDVGCNAGNLTISIAKRFRCKTMVGVDIDKGLVGRACKLLEKTAKSITNVNAKKKSSLDISGLNGKDASKKSSINLTSKALDNGLSGEELLERVSFKAENFVTRMEARPTYDTVLCLSVTKWVHLNWGDDGLLKLFAKIKNLLRPGGILVLEPQPWKSYKSNHLVSEVVRQNFHEIVLRPDQFKEVLLDRIGFRSMHRITEEVVTSAKGFSRPIFLLRC